MENLTLFIIKPDAMAKGYMGDMLSKIQKAGFKIKQQKTTSISKKEAEKFYEVHKARPFYNDLCSFICSGQVTVGILEKENAVEDFRKLIGATNPQEAEEGTLRKLFGANIDNNAVHGSDSNENAKIEISFFFTGRELV